MFAIGDVCTENLSGINYIELDDNTLFDFPFFKFIEGNSLQCESSVKTVWK